MSSDPFPKGALMFLALLLATSLASAQEMSIDLLLKARGLQANEKLEKLMKKNGDSRGKNLTAQELCEWSLEGAYVPFSTPALSDIVNKKNQGTTKLRFDIFIMIIREKNDMFQLNYTYDSKTKKLISADVRTLPAGWMISFTKGTEGTVNITSPSCIYLFNPINPLDSASVSTK